MQRKVMSRVVSTLIASFVLLGAHESAAARTQPASLGMPTAGAQMSNFTATPDGVTSAVSGAGTWAIPVTLDSPGAKSFIVRARVPTGSMMNCQAKSHGTNGALLGQSALIAVPATGTFQSITVPLPAAAVPAGAQVQVFCGFGLGTGHKLLGIDYTP